MNVEKVLTELSRLDPAISAVLILCVLGAYVCYQWVQMNERFTSASSAQTDAFLKATEQQNETAKVLAKVALLVEVDQRKTDEMLEGIRRIEQTLLVRGGSA
jgi:hypothetical protein